MRGTSILVPALVGGTLVAIGVFIGLAFVRGIGVETVAAFALFSVIYVIVDAIRDKGEVR